MIPDWQFRTELKLFTNLPLDIFLEGDLGLDLIILKHIFSNMISNLMCM